MARTESPLSRILAPVSCCWWYYWNSAAGDADKTAHGGVDFLEWFLDKAAQYEQQSGQRLLDYLDIHYYPDTFWNSGTDVTNAAVRLRGTRDLWRLPVAGGKPAGPPEVVKTDVGSNFWPLGFTRDGA